MPVAKLIHNVHQVPINNVIRHYCLPVYKGCVRSVTECGHYSVVIKSNANSPRGAEQTI